MWYVVAPERAQTIEFSRWVGDLWLLFNEPRTTTLPSRKIFLRGAFPLERKVVDSSVRNGPDRDDTSGLIGNVVQVAGAVQLHGPCGGDVRMHFPGPGRWDLPGLKAVAELSASFKPSVASHPGVGGPAALCAFTSKTLEVTSVCGEVVEGLLGRPVDFFGPWGLGI